MNIALWPVLLYTEILIHAYKLNTPAAARLRRFRGARTQAGEAQRGLRVLPQVPLRELPALHRGRAGPAGALVPRVAGGGLHAPAGLQGKRKRNEGERGELVLLYLRSNSTTLWSSCIICFSQKV